MKPLSQGVLFDSETISIVRAGMRAGGEKSGDEWLWIGAMPGPLVVFRSTEISDQRHCPKLLFGLDRRIESRLELTFHRTRLW